jgi:hypothetical protein
MEWEAMTCRSMRWRPDLCSGAGDNQIRRPVRGGEVGGSPDAGVGHC